VKLAIELEVPDDAINKTLQEEIVRSVKEQAVLKLYATDLITTGEAARMLGATRIQFLDLLQRSGVGFHVELDDEDFRTLRRRRDEGMHKDGR